MSKTTPDTPDTTPDMDFDTEPELPDLPATPVTEQHPAFGGDVQGEIEHRTPEPTGDRVFTKTFSVGVLGVADDHPMHEANAGGVIQDAVQRGLHPKGDVQLVASEEHDLGPRSQYTDLTYQVPVVPAVVDHDAASTTTVAGEHGPEQAELPAAGTVEPSAKATSRTSAKAAKQGKKTT